MSNQPSSSSGQRGEVDRIFDYPDVARRYATEPSEALQKRLKVARRKMDKALGSHDAAIRATTSMQSQSQRRAHASNVVSGLSNEIMWLELALQIQTRFPEFSYPNSMSVRKKVEVVAIEPLDVIHTFETAYSVVKEIVERRGLNSHRFYQASRMFSLELDVIFGERMPSPRFASPEERSGIEYDVCKRGEAACSRLEAENEQHGIRDHTPHFTLSFLWRQFYRTLDYRRQAQP